MYSWKQKGKYDNSSKTLHIFLEIYFRGLVMFYQNYEPFRKSL